MRSWAKGFSLIEIMVVLAIALTILVMVTPIFKTATRTVVVIERKLALYEAARNILDIMEADIALAVVNERGGHFSIKTVAWEDDDPFTAAGTSIEPGNNDVSNRAFRESRRFASALNYLRLEPTGFAANNHSYLGGGKCFPLAYTSVDNNFPEAWRCSIRSTLLHQTDAGYYSADYEVADVSGTWVGDHGRRWTRDEQLGNVKLIEASFNYRNVGHQWHYWTDSDGVPKTRHFDRRFDLTGVGQEIRQPPNFSGDQGYLSQRRIQGIRVMDIHFAYWDGVATQFQSPPLNSVIYFWPPPRAIRATITVCDFEKRDVLTMSRIVDVPVGLGDGLVQNTMDGYYEAADATFNRTKYLPLLPVVYTGDECVYGEGDYDVTDTKLLTNYKKPLNWP